MNSRLVICQHWFFSSSAVCDAQEDGCGDDSLLAVQKRIHAAQAAWQRGILAKMRFAMMT
jgi:hypothetical protein